MKDLLLAIQTSLREIEGPRDGDVFLSPDKDLIPETAKFPCIGIKDGRVDRSDLMGDVTELGLPVEIIVYEKLIKNDQAILSVFDLTAEIHRKLKENHLGDYIKSVSPGKETSIQLMYKKKGLILRKIISYDYEREEA